MYECLTYTYVYILNCTYVYVQTDMYVYIQQIFKFILSEHVKIIAAGPFFHSFFILEKQFPI